MIYQIGEFIITYFADFLFLGSKPNFSSMVLQFLMTDGNKLKFVLQNHSGAPQRPQYLIFGGNEDPQRWQTLWTEGGTDCEPPS